MLRLIPLFLSSAYTMRPSEKYAVYRYIFRRPFGDNKGRLKIFCMYRISC
ncbi:hypothetical protein l11_21060 [Neisseria weaveri LMG 5135]|nr:hypothetical protein l11_21060 [Neisseria weaveri LMG 5135]